MLKSDILVFSRTLEDHLQHLQLVIRRIQEVGLKLKPGKCHFLRQEVEYLGHVVTPDGVRPNPKLISAVQDYSAPRNVKEIRRFLGLTSFYHRFIPQYAKVAHPLHQLTRKHSHGQVIVRQHSRS